MKICWVLEENAFPETHAEMKTAVIESGHEVFAWSDDWLNDLDPPACKDQFVIFHGSLGNAALIQERFTWTPGAFCNTEKFSASQTIPLLGEHAVHQSWHCLSVGELVAAPDHALDRLNSPAEFFVRPDSPLKPFSGRVLKADSVTLRALDFGFYYEEESLPVVIAPVRQIGREWRFVVVNGTVVAGCGYESTGRVGIDGNDLEKPRRFAQTVAAQIQSPERVYVLDVCEADGELRVMELNPFSGADLYSCNRRDVVDTVNQTIVNAH